MKKINQDVTLTPKQRKLRTIAYVLFAIQGLSYFGVILELARGDASVSVSHLPVIIGIILLYKSKKQF